MQQQQPIKNSIITILGLPGSGKTFFATLIGSTYQSNRLFANFQIYKNGKKVNKVFNDIEDIEKIKFNKIKGCIIIDEGGININSRRSGSERNLIFGKLGFLSRKKNCDIIIIAQLERSTDVYFRELSSLILYMSSYFVDKNYLIFETYIKKQTVRGEEFLGYKIYDLLARSKRSGYTYNTLESSEIE